MSSFSIRQSAATIVFGLFILYVNPTAAQESEQDSFTLEEITVTAQKRAENQQKVPIAMDTISAEDIRDMGYSDLDEIITSISSVYINEAGDGLRVSIRGMSSDETHRGDLHTISNSMPVVAVNTDGVFTAGRKSGANMYDLERVEVLFGPQSTLYASNSPGGIVNVITGSPKLDTYEASGKIEYGNYDALQTEGMMNVPVNDMLAMRASFMTSTRDGYMANGADDDNTKSARLKVLVAPSEDLSITLTGQYLLDQGMGIAKIDMFVDQDDVSDPWDNSNEATPVPRKRVNNELNAQLDWDLGFGNLTFQPAYSKMDETAHMTMEDMFTGEEYENDMDNEQEEKGAELRIASPENSFFDWIFGVNYYEFHQEGLGYTVDTPYWSGNINDIETKAAYGNVTYPVTDRFRASFGLRYSDDENDGHFYMVRDTVMDVHSYLHYTGFDHKIGFEYDIAEDSMFYADWSTGYRVGSMGGAEEDPETLNAYQMGAKNRFFDNRLQVNWSAYYYMYEHYPAEVMMEDPITHTRDMGGLTQGDMLMYGSDLQTDMILSANDRLELSISWEKAEFDKMVFDFESEALDDLIYTGKPLTFTPEWTVNAAYEHNFNFTNGAGLVARFDTRYQSSMLINFMDIASATTPEGPVVVDLTGYNKQEAYTQSNCSLTYTSPDGKWTLSGYVKNIEDYAVKKNLMFQKLMIGPPRTYGAVLSVRY